MRRVPVPPAHGLAANSRRKLLTLAVLLLPVSVGGPALAHAILVDSDPPLGGSMAAGPRILRLRFNSRIDQARSRLTLVDARQAPIVLPISPDSAVDELRATATLQPGAAVIRWQVLATDGHITRGEVPFTVSGS